MTNTIVRVFTKYDQIPHTIALSEEKCIPIHYQSLEDMEWHFGKRHTGIWETFEYHFISKEIGLEGVQFITYERRGYEKALDIPR
jgi:hypothetical protein